MNFSHSFRFSASSRINYCGFAYTSVIHNRDDILNLYVTSRLPLPSSAIPTVPGDWKDDEVPF